MLLLGEIVWFGLVRFGLAVLGRARLESEQEREREEAGVPGVRGVNPSLGCTIVGTRSVRLLWAVAAPPRPPSSPARKGVPGTKLQSCRERVRTIGARYTAVFCARRPAPRSLRVSRESPMSISRTNHWSGVSALLGLTGWD